MLEISSFEKDNNDIKINNGKNKDKLSKLNPEFQNDYLELDSSFEGQKESVTIKTKQELQDFKKELIEKYSNTYKNLTKEIVDFFDDAFDSKNSEAMSDFNISKFDDKDGIKGFSDYELEQFAQILDKAMNQMNILGTYKEFKEKYNEVGEEPSFLNWKGDIKLSNKIDFQEKLLGASDEHLTDHLNDFSERELSEMRDQKFDITDGESMKNFIILLGLELGEGVEDILKFIGNIPAALVVLPRYLYNRGVLLGKGGVDNENEVEAEMENDLLLKENPSLMILEILGEKGVDMIKELGKMFVSGTNGDIATVSVMIAGLLAGGAGAVKIGAKMGKLSRVEKVASKIQSGASRIDDVIGGAGVGHLTGQFKSPDGVDKIPVQNIERQEDLVEKSKKQKQSIDSKEKNDLFSENIPKIKENRELLYNYIDELVENTDSGKVPEKNDIGKRAKELIDEILIDPNISEDSLTILKDVRKAIEKNMGGMSLRSLNHILESFSTSTYIPKNPDVQKMLAQKFGDISEAELYAQISVFHDLVKNSLPTSVVQFISSDINGKLSILKGGQLASHQLESANFLRKQIDKPDSDIYKAIENFLDSRGIPKEKTPEYMEMISKVIEGHGGNTEFIQADTVGGMKNIISNIDDSYLKLDNVTELFEGLKEKGILSVEKSDKLLKQASEISDNAERLEFIRKSFIKEFIENNIGKKIDISDIDIGELQKLFDIYGTIDKQVDLGRFLDSDLQNPGDLQKIIDNKTQILLNNKDLINKYLHTSDGPDLGLEGARFSFNINDISGYVNPSTEGFTKLIMFNKIDNLISSPMNSSLAVLSELKSKIAKETNLEYKTKLENMYENGFDNMKKLGEVYKTKLGEKLKNNVPDYFKDKGIDTFGEAYSEAIELSKKLENGTPEAKEFDEIILPYFKSEFTNMCLNSEMNDLFI